MKKLSLEELNNLHIIVCNKLRATMWRAGQALFNCLYESHPELADSLRATSVDCFNNNNRIPIFLQEIAEDKEELEISNWKTILQQLKSENYI